MIFMPILIIGILSFIFYFFFFVICCCSKARARNYLDVVSIVFFALITACILIAIIFHIVGAVYLMNIINFFTSDQIYDELTGINNKISTALNGISDGLFVNSLAPTLIDSVNSTISNITLYGDFNKNLNENGSEKQDEVEVVENYYNEKCVKQQLYSRIC